MSHITKIILFIIFLTTSNTCLADGNKLLHACNNAITLLDNKDEPNNSKKASALYCMGLVKGVTDMHTLFSLDKTAGMYCAPENELKVIQRIRIVVKYLDEHPEKLHDRDSMLIALAFIDAFPCGK